MHARRPGQHLIGSRPDLVRIEGDGEARLLELLDEEDDGLLLILRREAGKAMPVIIPGGAPDLAHK